MKLVEILARELKEWPNSIEPLTQSAVGHEIIYDNSVGTSLDPVFFPSVRHTEDDVYPAVTRAQWEAERARILLESQPERDADVAKVVDGVSARSAEDQALWDIVAREHYIEFLNDERKNPSGRPFRVLMSFAAKAADEFMAERAKRMEG